MVVRGGGMLNAFGPQAGKKTVNPENGDLTISSEGFNKKNHYNRKTPCDQDYLRKLSKDTDADDLMKWFSSDVVKVFRRHCAFDKEGVFVGDASYLFVPDNPRYEGSVKLFFDEHNHPISEKAYKGMSDDNKARCRWRRCYKMVTLLHTNRARDFFLFVGAKVVSGKDHECPIFYSLVDQFVDVVGKGVIKELILDRGFLDGRAISACKKNYGINILIPVRSNMDIYKDAMALFKQPEVDWKLYEEPEAKKKKRPRPQPEAIRKRERKRQETLAKQRKEKPVPPPEKTIVKIENAAIGEFRSLVVMYSAT